jgi:hypothetical protein
VSRRIVSQSTGIMNLESDAEEKSGVSESVVSSKSVLLVNENIL